VHKAYTIPRRFFFTFNFFDFGQTTTESVIFKQQNDLSQFPIGRIGLDQPMIFVRENYFRLGTQHKEPIYRFDFDASLGKGFGEDRN
jgi:hypothetical protein